MSDSASYTQVTSKLDCNKCVWGMRSGGCASWECEFIDRDDAVKAWRNMPSAEPERKKGKWIWQIENRYVCSECGHHTQVDELFEEPMYAFCPYCSTSMLDEDGNVRYER